MSMHQHGNPDIPGLVALYANISRMRVLSSVEVVERAEQVAEKIMDTYSVARQELRRVAQHGQAPCHRSVARFQQGLQERKREPQEGASAERYSCGFD